MYAVQILDGTKTEEYRSWKTKVRGTVLVHSSHMSRKEYTECIPDGLKPAHRKRLEDYYDDMPQGLIIGSVDIVDCVEHYENGERNGYAFKLENPFALEYQVPMKGRLGFWKTTIC